MPLDPPASDPATTNDLARTNDDADSPAYSAAVAELEQILAELEGDDPDVDVLTVRVRRAAELITLCRGRIRAAQDEVERVVAQLDDPIPQTDDTRP